MTYDGSKSLGERLYGAFVASGLGYPGQWANVDPDYQSKWEAAAVSFTSRLSDGGGEEEVTVSQTSPVRHGDPCPMRPEGQGDLEWRHIPSAHRFGRFLTEDAVPLIAPGTLLRFYSGDPWFEPSPDLPRCGEIVAFTGKVSNTFPKVGPHLEVATLDGKVWPGGGWAFRLFQFVSDPVPALPHSSTGEG